MSLYVYLDIALALGLGFATIRLLIARQSRERGAFYLATYQNRALPLFMRNAIVALPLGDIALVIIALSLLVSRDVGRWLWVVAIAWFGLVYVVATRVPPPGLPRWLREDIEAGRVEVARPDTGDRIMYWSTMVLLVVGLIALTLLAAGVFGAH